MKRTLVLRSDPKKSKQVYHKQAVFNICKDQHFQKKIGTVCNKRIRRNKSARVGKRSQKKLQSFVYDTKEHVGPVSKTLEEPTEKKD